MSNIWKTILVITGGLILAGGIWWLLSVRQVKPDSNPALLTYSDWQTYDNPTYGYELKYPKNWFSYLTLNPPPPTTVMLASSPEGTKPGDYASVEIFVTTKTTDNLDEIGEVTNQVANGAVKMAATVGGQAAVQINTVDTIAKHTSYYVIKGYHQYRIGYQYPLNDATNKDICEKIITSYKFK